MQTTPTSTTPNRFPYPPEMAQAFAEMAKANVSLSAQQQATELQLRRTAELQEITAKGLAELRESTKRMGEQLGGMADLRESTNALRESTKRMGEQLGGISNNQGAVAEDFFYNSLLERPQVGPFKFSKITPHWVVGSKGKQTEFDLVLVNGKSVVVVEVKYKLHPAHIDKLTDQLKAFRKLNPEFKGFELYGALAGLSVPSAVRAAAAERGYMVLQRKGEALHAVTEGLRAQ